MINTLTDKINKSLQKNLQNLSEESLFTVKLIKEIGLENVLNKIKEKINTSEFLNFRVLSIFQKEKIKEETIKENRIKIDNKILFNEIIKLSPNLADQYLEAFYKPKESSSRNGIIVDSKESVLALSNHAFSLKYRNYNTKIVNPFTNNLIDSTFFNYKKSKEFSAIYPARNRILDRDGDKSHSMKISINGILRYKDFKPIKEMSPQNTAFEFTIYHELAHASFPQMMNNYGTQSEKNSDISAIIKMIKNHDLNQEEAQELCNNVISFRVNSNTIDLYDKYTKRAEVTSHYTEDALLSLKKVLETELEEVKKLPDDKICRYSNILVDLNRKNESVLFGLSEHVTKIDPNIISKAIEEHDQNMIKAGPINETDKWFREASEEVFIDTLNENKGIYEEVLIRTKLKENFNDNLNELYEMCANKNPEIGKEVRELYSSYEKNLKENKINVKRGFDSETFSKSINKIS